MASVFIETSIVSYLRSKQSGHVVTAGKQIQTRRWWEERRSGYDLYASILVIEEASRGDAALAAERLSALADLPLLAISDEVEMIGRKLVERAALPEKAQVDALHISTLAVRNAAPDPLRLALDGGTYATV